MFCVLAQSITQAFSEDDENELGFDNFKFLISIIIFIYYLFLLKEIRCTA